MTTPPLAPSHRYVVRTRYEAAELAHRVAALTSSPDRVELPLIELLLNAIEHGSLELGCERKRELVLEGKLDEEIARRQALSPYDTRFVQLEAWIWDHGVRFVIEDQGPGFDWRGSGGGSMAHTGPNGRGLSLTRAFTEHVTFNDRGNVVTAELQW